MPATAAAAAFRAASGSRGPREQRKISWSWGEGGEKRAHGDRLGIFAEHRVVVGRAGRLHPQHPSLIGTVPTIAAEAPRGCWVWFV